MNVLISWVMMLTAVILPIIIGIYVYRDASRRGMNAVTWALVAMLAPTFIGFIIYLLVRENYSNLRCPQCDTAVTERYVVCPKCGAKLQPACPNCNEAIQLDWKLCPKCTLPLPESYEDITPPSRRKDKTLRKILFIVIIVPILLIVLMAPSFFDASMGESTSTMRVATFDELYNAQQTSEVKDWLESVKDDKSKTYVLQYMQTTPQGEKQYLHVIYVPAVDVMSDYEYSPNNGGFFNDIMRLDFCAGDQGNNSVLCVATTSEKPMKLEIYCDGRKLDCELTNVDFDPTGGLVEHMEEA